MTCCSHRKMLERRLDEVLARLESSYIHEKIDAPLDRAAAEFPFTELPDPVSASEFIQILGRVLNYIYEKGLRVPRRLDAEQAEAEAVSLLDQYYPGVRGARFESAWIGTASEGREALLRVADFLLAVVKNTQRRQHEQWTLKQLTAPLTWPERVALTEVLLKRIHWQLPQELADANPKQFANQLPQLVLHHAESNEFRCRPVSG